MEVKVHFEDYTVTENAPEYQKEEWRKSGEKGALCGYIRKHTTRNKEVVTCFYCKRKLTNQPPQ